MNTPEGYRAFLPDVIEGLNDLLSALEEIRDDAQDTLDERDDETVRGDIRRLDEAIGLLSSAADLLETEDGEA